MWAITSERALVAPGVLEPNVYSQASSQEGADQRDGAVVGIRAGTLNCCGGCAGVVDVPCQQTALQVVSESREGDLYLEELTLPYVGAPQTPGVYDLFWHIVAGAERDSSLVDEPESNA